MNDRLEDKCDCRGKDKGFHLEDCAYWRQFPKKPTYDELQTEVERLRGEYESVVIQCDCTIAALRAEVKNISVQKDANASLAAEHRATIATLRAKLDTAIRWAEFTDEQLDEFAATEARDQSWHEGHLAPIPPTEAPR